MTTSDDLSGPELRVDGSRLWRELIFAEIEGYRPLVMDVVVPGGAGPHPLLIYLHGGAWFKGSRNALPSTVSGMGVIARMLANGIAVATVMYRFSAEARFPAQLHDVKAAVRFLRANATRFDIDPKRFAAWGASAGGHLACLLGLTPGRADLEGDVGEKGPSSAVQAVVDWYGPTDLLEMNRQAIEGSTIDHDAPESPEGQLIGAPIQTQPDAARRASPMTYVGDVKPPPFLIVHGERDRLVPAGQSVLLAEALEKAGADVELSLVPEADHVFVGDPDLPERIDELIAFLRKKLVGSSSGNRS